ncbi:MAG: GTP 3',8-cyclase MoaA [Spirochaetales bacterium]|nr:GTP 3',8-cyclase MoaA [Spirochaetales bacterium]
MVDLLGRPIRDLRVSVTDSCNFRCTYCLPSEAFPRDYAFLKPDQLLRFSDIELVVAALLPLGLQKVKITGGEPLLRPLLVELIALLKGRWPGLEVALITNGHHLAPLVKRIRKAGLDSVTVSLDALDPTVFGRMTGNAHRLDTVLAGIEEAHREFEQVKINTVLIRGENDDQVEALAKYFQRPGFALRFIEYMDVGSLNRWRRDQVVTGAEVLERLQKLKNLFPLPKRHPGETSERWVWSEAEGEVGFINSVSRPFCAECVRVRLSADGKLYTCLFSNRSTDLKPVLLTGNLAEVTQTITAVWKKRDDRYSEQRQSLAGTTRQEMFTLGG